MERSSMIQEVERKKSTEKQENLDGVLISVVQAIVFVLVCIGFSGFIFLAGFLFGLLDFVFTGEESQSLRFWLPGMMSGFLIFFKFPRLNKFWEVLLEKIS